MECDAVITEAFLKRRTLANGREFILESVPLRKRYYPVDTSKIRMMQNLELDTAKAPYDVALYLGRKSLVSA